MDLASDFWQMAMSMDAKRRVAFVTHEGLYQFRGMSFGICNVPAAFERLMDSCGTDASEALLRLEEVLGRLSSFGLQLKAKRCIFMQMEVAFLRHIVGQSGLASDPVKISAVWAWHEPGFG